MPPEDASANSNTSRDGTRSRRRRRSRIIGVLRPVRQIARVHRCEDSTSDQSFSNGVCACFRPKQRSIRAVQGEPVVAPQLLTSERRPVLKQELLGDRTQGESGRVFQPRDASNHTEEEDVEKRPSVGKVLSVGATLFFSAADSELARVGMVCAITSRRAVALSLGPKRGVGGIQRIAGLSGKSVTDPDFG